MKPFLRSTRLAVGILSVAIFAWVTPRPAAAGFCQGRREGIRLYVEYLGRRIEQRIVDSFFDLKLLADGLTDIPPDLALWSLHLQARARLSAMLTKAAAGQDGEQPSYQDIRATLQPYWNKAAAIQRVFRQADVDPRAALDGTLTDIVVRWSACQSLASRSLAACDLVGGIDPRRRKGCRGDLARLVVLYGGDCQGDLAEQAAKILGLSIGKLHAACEILSKGQVARCKEFGEFDYFCRALCEGDESICRARHMADKKTRECLRDMYLFETIKNKKPLTDFEKRYPDSRRVIMLRALFGKEDCLLSALNAYDQGAGIPFMLRAQAWQLLLGTP